MEWYFLFRSEREYGKSQFWCASRFLPHTWEVPLWPLTEYTGESLNRLICKIVAWLPVPMKWNFCPLFYSRKSKSMLHSWFVILESLWCDARSNFFPLQSWQKMQLAIPRPGTSDVIRCVNFDQFTSSQYICYSLSCPVGSFTQWKKSSDDELSSNTSSSCDVESLKLAVERESSVKLDRSALSSRVEVEGDVAAKHDDNQDGIRFATWKFRFENMETVINW